MAAYATVTDVQNRMTRQMSSAEQTTCATLLDDAKVIIDAYARPSATADDKKVVSCRMVMRALGDGQGAYGVPMGATQGSMSGLGYSQSWTMGTGSSGELYLSKLEKKMLGCGDAIGSWSPVQEMVPEEDEG